MDSPVPVVSQVDEDGVPQVEPRTTVATALAALGIVYGDLGTSPLYTYQTIVGTVGGHPTAAEALGLLSLGSRDKVGGRNEIREVIRGEPLANQGIHSAAADYNLPFHARPQRTECNVVSDLGSLRNFVPRP